MSTRSMLLASVIAASLSLAGQVLATPVVTHVEGQRVSWPEATGSAHQLRLTAPDGSVAVHDFASGRAVAIEQTWQDGHYRFELVQRPAIDAWLRAQGRGDHDRGRVPDDATDSVILSGGFIVEAGGRISLGGNDEPRDHDVDGVEPPQRSTRDQVIADDLIVQGRLCVGSIDCVDGEVLDFQTLKIKHNNPRIRFDDTSATAGFTANDWSLTANDSVENGLNYLAIEDVTAGTRPFWVKAGGLTDSLVVDNNRIGIGTRTPLLGIHHNRSDTPGIRLEQNNTGGFAAQTWDVAGNEANFFVRDLTGGSLLPFRIRPGAPTSTLDLTATGNVGIGTASAVAKLDIYRASGADPLLRIRTNAAGSEVTQMQLEADGNLRVNGTISQLSSRSAKTGFVDIDPGAVLDAVASLPISFWSYLHQRDGIRHVGPTAEDFHAAFGLGERPTEIATGDMAGVALVAIQALNEEVAERDRRIEDLEARLRRLEARLIDDAAQH